MTNKAGIDIFSKKNNNRLRRDIVFGNIFFSQFKNIENKSSIEFENMWSKITPLYFQFSIAIKQTLGEKLE